MNYVECTQYRETSICRLARPLFPGMSLTNTNPRARLQTHIL